MHIITDRSRIESASKCRRRRYYEYGYRGRGRRLAAAIPPIWPLETGSWVHKGLEDIHRGATPIVAANAAATAYAITLSTLFLQVEDQQLRGQLEWEAAQQTDLVLALVYGWGQLRYPEYAREFEMVDVEREEQITFDVGDDQVTLLTRTDKLSRYRTSGSYVIHNYKTVSKADQKWRQGFRYDPQTLTEAHAAENRLGQRVEGVIIEGLVKGRRSEYPEGSGHWQHNSPLIYVWYKDGEPPMVPADYRPRYQWTCMEPHSTGGRGRASECPGGRLHRLSGYRKERVQSVYPGGITAWIDWLLINDRAIVEEQFLVLEPIMRSEWEVERWKRQVLPHEVEMAAAAIEIERYEHLAEAAELMPPGSPLTEQMRDATATYNQLIDYHFPMNSSHGNCIQPDECPFLHICWGSDDIEDSKFASREANHPAEGEIMRWASDPEVQ